MVGAVRFWGTAVLAGLALLLLLPFHLLALTVGGRHRMAVARLWQRFVCALMGIRITVTGAPASVRPLLLLANHVSWLDIPILAAVAPVSFVAKQEVAGWPVVGFLARAQRSVFIDRQRRGATGTQADEMAGRLSTGDIIVLFAEGTSSDGNHVLPFRSALVGAAQRAVRTGGAATVQPVAIAYRRILGLPLGPPAPAAHRLVRRHRPAAASEARLSDGGIDVQDVVSGPPRMLAPGDDRKAAAHEAGRLVRRLVAALNAGRPAGPVPRRESALADGGSFG
jgi:1-acyl-sn-glycerol-3-phosphate acyltransferase